MNEKRNIAGVTVFVSNETYNEYKGTLQEQIDELQQRIDKAIGYTKQFINGKTSRIDEWKNVELVLETIVEILGDKE